MISLASAIALIDQPRATRAVCSERLPLRLDGVSGAAALVLWACTTLGCAAGPGAAGVPAAAPEVSTPAPGASSPAAETTGTPPRAPEGVETPSSEALLLLGVCKESGTILEVREYPVKAGARLLEVNCENFAYQGSYEFWHQGPSGLEPALGSVGSPLRLLGLPRYDTNTQTLTWLEKARGPGDCGSWYKYELEGKTFTLREHRERACSAGATADSLPPPSEWPLM